MLVILEKRPCFRPKLSKKTEKWLKIAFFGFFSLTLHFRAKRTKNRVLGELLFREESESGLTFCLSPVFSEILTIFREKPQKSTETEFLGEKQRRRGKEEVVFPLLWFNQNFQKAKRRTFSLFSNFTREDPEKLDFSGKTRFSGRNLTLKLRKRYSYHFIQWKSTFCMQKFKK